jgi:hypothetical protein
VPVWKNDHYPPYRRELQHAIAIPQIDPRRDKVGRDCKEDLPGCPTSQLRAVGEAAHKTYKVRRGCLHMTVGLREGNFSTCHGPCYHNVLRDCYTLAVHDFSFRGFNPRRCRGELRGSLGNHHCLCHRNGMYPNRSRIRLLQSPCSPRDRARIPTPPTLQRPALPGRFGLLLV